MAVKYKINAYLGFSRSTFNTKRGVAKAFFYSMSHATAINDGVSHF
jgi:hypothetical protein